jgi:hypothetical protein
MALLYVDPNTLKITVNSTVDDPFIPSEETIVIKKMAEGILASKQKYLEEIYNPMIDSLMERVMDYNAKDNPEVAKKWKAMKAEKKKNLAAAKKKSTIAPSKKPTTSKAKPAKSTKKKKNSRRR